MYQDNRFCLIDENGSKMPAAKVCGEFRFGKGRHDAVLTIEEFAIGIVKEKKTGRFVTPEGRNTIGLDRRKAVGYELDSRIASKIGVPTQG